MNQKTISKVIIFFLIISLSHFYAGFSEKIRISPENPSSSEIDCVDAWIIILGDNHDHDIAEELWLTSQWVYHMVHAIGTDYDDIYYLVAHYMLDYTAFEDQVSSDANIRYAFDTWAPSKVGPNGMLGVYIVGHSNVDLLGIVPVGTHTASEFEADLNAFEAASGCDRILFVYDGCHSGSMIDNLSKPNRIIITATTDVLGADISPIPPHRATFADNFFPSVLAGNSVGDAFVDANDALVALGYAQTQNPWIDDNHDGVGNTVNEWGGLPNNNDGYDANYLYISGDCQPEEIIAPKFNAVPMKKWYEFDPGLVTIPVSVEILNVTNIASAYVRVVPSDWEPPTPIDEGTMGGYDPAEDTYRHYLTLDAASGDFTGEIELWSPVEGDYNLCFIVEDEDGYRGPIVATQVGLNADGVSPEDTVDPTVAIRSPYGGQIITEPTTVVAIGADDNSGLEDIQLFINGALVETEIMPNFLPYPELAYTLDPTAYGNGDLNITAIATDKEGNSASFSVTVIIENEPKIPGYSIWMLVSAVSVGLFAVYLYAKRKMQ